MNLLKIINKDLEDRALYVQFLREKIKICEITGEYSGQYMQFLEKELECIAKLEARRDELVLSEQKPADPEVQAAWDHTMDIVKQRLEQKLERQVNRDEN